MATDKTLRRGKPETRTNYERARDDFAAAKGGVHQTWKVVECPSCGKPMECIREYKGKSYHFVGTCSASDKHNIERYGYGVSA